MGKRSTFSRISKDAYQTIDKRAVAALLPFLIAGTRFAEPFAGDGHLIRELEAHGHHCTYRNDIAYPNGKDAALTTSQDLNQADMVISNPPWSRNVLHPMVECLSLLEKPIWFLFDADWAYTKQSSTYMRELCTDIVAVGRLIWIPDTKMSGKDSCSWYRFSRDKHEPTHFYGRI